MEKKGIIYLVPSFLTPEKDLATLPAQIQQAVKTVDIFLAENIRSARRFLSAIQTQRPIEQLKFYTLDKDTPEEEINQFIDLANSGNNLGIISEAGCPAIADPGAKIVRLAHKKNILIKPLVGPSSILLALMASGLNGQHFIFHGYLPIEKQKRASFIKKIEKDSAQKNQTQIFMETPYRNNQLFETIIRTCLPHTFLCIASNITAPNEFILTQDIKKWQQNKIDLHKQPTIFLLLNSNN